MKKLFLFQFLLFAFFISCENKDPELTIEAPKSDLPNIIANLQVPIVDFEDESNRSIWGWEYSGFDVNDGQITLHIIDEDPIDITRGKVMQINYDVSSNSSQAVWLQPLTINTITIGAFNASTMGLQYLSFYARGESGGEVILPTLNDTNNNHTYPSPDIELSTNWVKHRVPLSDLEQGNVDLKALASMDITFENGIGPSIGIIYLDEFAFEWE